MANSLHSAMWTGVPEEQGAWIVLATFKSSSLKQWPNSPQQLNRSVESVLQSTCMVMLCECFTDGLAPQQIPMVCGSLCVCLVNDHWEDLLISLKLFLRWRDETIVMDVWALFSLVFWLKWDSKVKVKKNNLDQRRAEVWHVAWLEERWSF